MDNSGCDQTPQVLGLAQKLALATLLEVTAPKPGNVHRSADFEDVGFTDFLAAGVAVAPILERAAEQGVGLSVLSAVRMTQATTRSNTNLGTLLLLAPLSAATRRSSLRQGLTEVLSELTPADSDSIYQAIAAANPGGIANVDQLDVHGAAPADLLEAMQLAADRDLVARQYINDFAEVFTVSAWLAESRERHGSLTEAIVLSHVRLMAAYPDSLIARKCGLEVASEAAQRAELALAAGEPGDPAYLQALEELDFWLRADGHRRNPGTTADLIAAALFVGLCEGDIQPPFN